MYTEPLRSVLTTLSCRATPVRPDHERGGGGRGEGGGGRGEGGGGDSNIKTPRCVCQDFENVPILNDTFSL